MVDTGRVNDNKELITEISAAIASSKDKIRGKINQKADMRKLTWFRTGGEAELFFQPEDEEDLACFLSFIPKEMPLTLVGIGSNLLVRDGGIDNIVLRLSNKAFTEINWLSETCFEAGCGVSDKKIALSTAQKAIGGFHFYYGIPGSLGGALRMNAGANGVETQERVLSIRAMDRQGNIHVFKKEELGFSYRHIQIPEDYIFLSATLEGYKSTWEEIHQKMEDVRLHRETVQPVKEKTGGSTFRNPDGTSAWKLIEEAGCRGLTLGGAQMSEMHCNFMINKGSASAYELELLGETVRERVYAHSKVLLHWEIARIGCFEKGREVKTFVP